MKDVNNLIHINKINCNLYGFQNQFKVYAMELQQHM